MSKTSKQTQSIDPYTKGLQQQNYQSALQRFGGASYSPLTGDKINQYMNPYNTSVIDAALGDNDHSRMMARNSNTDEAIRAHAFGGSGLDVANGLTEGEYDRNAQGFIANLRNQGFNTATGIAQGENTATNNFPLLLQQLLNGTVQTLTPDVTTKGTSSDPMDTAGKAVKTAGQVAQLAAMFSDLRLKHNVETTHHDAKGRRWVSFKYNWDDETIHHGVIAQEVQQTDPEAVIEHESGYLMVDYGKLH